MQPYYDNGGIVIYHDDCRNVVPHLPVCGLVVTDPPYGVGYVTLHRYVSAAPPPIVGDETAPLWAAELMYKATRDSGAAYVFTCFDVFGQWQQALATAGFTVKTPIVWDKGNWTAGDLTGDYGCQTELILFAHCGRHELRRGRDTNLWRFMRPPAGEHPTPKPLGCMTRAMRNSATPGDIVLDPFMGSGSTLVAAKNVGLKAVGVEVEERYCEIAAKRLSQEVLELGA